jgi:hypothetical protein
MVMGYLQRFVLIADRFGLGDARHWSSSLKLRGRDYIMLAGDSHHCCGILTRNIAPGIKLKAV